MRYKISNPRHRCYKHPIYPDEYATKAFHTWFYLAGEVWNWALDYIILVYNQNKTFLFMMSLSRDFTKYKKMSPWFEDLPRCCVTSRLKDLEKAIKLKISRKAKKLKGGFPKKKDVRQRNSVRLEAQNFKIEGDYLILPAFRGKRLKVRVNFYREIKGRILNVTIKKEHGKFYAVFSCELPEVDKKDIKTIPSDRIVGLDAGIGRVLATSDGIIVEKQNFIKKKEKLLKRRQRQLARKKKQSKNYHKQRKKVAKIHEKIANQRHYFCHKTSREIADNYDIVFVETLNIGGWKRNRNWGKAVSDNAIAKIYQLLEYKMEDRGGYFVKIDQWLATSKTCSCCGHKKPVLGLHERTFTCESCGHSEDRDINAAKNIKKMGIAAMQQIGNGTSQIHACGECADRGDGILSPSHHLLKQETEQLPDTKVSGD